MTEGSRNMQGMVHTSPHTQPSRVTFSMPRELSTGDVTWVRARGKIIAAPAETNSPAPASPKKNIPSSVPRGA